MRRRVLVALAVTAVALVVAVRGCRRRAADVGETARVAREAIERIVIASGTIEPEQLVEVRPKVSGIVERFLVDAGDPVEAGQVVAEIDRETLAAAVREAEAVLREAEVARDQAATELARHRPLLARGLEARETFDRAETEHARADAQVARARATLDRLQQELSYATITSPIDGVVLARDLDPGAAAASIASVVGGTVLMTIADVSQMHLKGVVDENEIARVQVGMEARIRTEAYGDRVFPGRVRKIAPLGTRASNVTSFDVEVTVTEDIADLWPRMSADADIVSEVHAGALVVPEAALVYDGDDVLVEVVEQHSAANVVRRKIRTGIVNGARVEILDGLAEGDVVKLQ